MLAAPPTRTMVVAMSGVRPDSKSSGQRVQSLATTARKSRRFLPVVSMVKNGCESGVRSAELQFLR